MSVTRYVIVMFAAGFGSDDIAAFDTLSEAEAELHKIQSEYPPSNDVVYQVEAFEDDEWDIMDSDSPLLGGPLTPGHDNDE